MDFRGRHQNWNSSGGNNDQPQDLCDLRYPIFTQTHVLVLKADFKAAVQVRMFPDSSLSELSMPHTGSFQRSLRPLRGITSVFAW